MSSGKPFKDQFALMEEAQRTAGDPVSIADAVLHGNRGEGIIRMILPSFGVSERKVVSSGIKAEDIIRVEEVLTDSLVSAEKSVIEGMIHEASQDNPISLSKWTGEDSFRTFEEWLDWENIIISGDTQKHIETKEDDLKTLDKQIQLEIPFHMVTNILEKETHYAGDLTDFLQSEKQKKRPVRRKAKGNQSDQVVTETMAKVYLAQGNLDKAIDVYRLLILKNPAKSTIFANQIEKLLNKS